MEPIVDEITVLAESDATHLCSIRSGLEADGPLGFQVAELKALICSLCPPLSVSAIQLRSHPARVLLADSAHVKGGQTVHVCERTSGSFTAKTTWSFPVANISRDGCARSWGSIPLRIG